MLNEEQKKLIVDLINSLQFKVADIELANRYSAVKQVLQEPVQAEVVSEQT